MLAGHAATDVVVDGVTYEWYENSVAHQYGYVATGWDGETPVQALHIRGEIDGYQVFGIANEAFEDNEDIVYLTIDEGVIFIGYNAFCRCHNIEVAILPEGLEIIEEEAFAFCNNLTTMVIPSTVTDIQAHAFWECTSVTDVYFLMTDEEQLASFNWWDGVYEPGNEQHGGMEFNTNQHTIIHVPEGMLQDYVDSEKFVAWIPLFQDDNCYPLWWIVNFGVVGREYTVSDDLTAVYVDVDGNLYAKDDNHWLTPDKVYPDEIDYIKTTGLMNELGNRYDQSNWVALADVESPEGFLDNLIAGNSVTATLIDKKNPLIKVNSNPVLKLSDSPPYVPNRYIPASFMRRAQIGSDYKSYAFVQPKPQELIHVELAVYNESDECFYIPEPNDDDVNVKELVGGVAASYDIYEQPPAPELTDCGVYAFSAVNRRIGIKGEKLSQGQRDEYTPYADGGVSNTFVVFVVEMLDESILTGIRDAHLTGRQDADTWHTVEGKFLGNDTPTAPGIYIRNSDKVVIR